MESVIKQLIESEEQARKIESDAKKESKLKIKEAAIAANQIVNKKC